MTTPAPVDGGAGGGGVPAAAAGLHHLRPLDGLRAVAIGIVFVAHCGLERVVPGGFGVTIFFFLSGYLITSLLRSELAQTGRIDLRTFYLRRTLRIWPSLYLTLFAAGLLARVVPAEHPVTVSGVAAQLLFVSNYAGCLGMGTGVPWIPLWSLAVEEHFYLLFPLLAATVMRRWEPARIARWCAGACVAVLGIRVGCALTVPNLDAIYYWSHTRIDSILFGCCLALWQNPALDADAWRPRGRHLFGAVAVLLLCLAVRDELFRQTLRYTLQGAALFVIFSYAVADRGIAGRILGSAALRPIALWSYTLYLVHVPVIEALAYWAPGLPLAGVIAAAAAISCAYAAAMYRFVERPAARARQRLHRVDRATDDTGPSLGSAAAARALP